MLARRQPAHRVHGWNEAGRICGRGAGERREHRSWLEALWLMEQIIRDYTKPGELICDPFSGGGTTGLAAVKMGRRFLGWEQKPEHHAFAMKFI